MCQRRIPERYQNSEVFNGMLSTEIGVELVIHFPNIKKYFQAPTMHSPQSVMINTFQITMHSIKTFIITSDVGRYYFHSSNT